MFELFKEINLVKNNLSEVNNVPPNEILPSIFFNLYNLHYKEEDLGKLAKEYHISLNLSFKNEGYPEW